MTPTTRDDTPFLRLAELTQKLEATTKRLEKRALLAAFLRFLRRDEIAPAVHLIVGRIFAESDSRALNVGWATLKKTFAGPKQSVLVPRPLTILEAPVDIQGKGNKSILRIVEDPVPTLQLIGDKGSVKLEILESGGAVFVKSANSTKGSALYQDANGDGVCAVVDKSGKITTQIAKDGVTVFNSGGKAITRLGTSPTKGEVGYLAIGNASGDAMVEAGLVDVRGIVRTYPFNPSVGEMLQGSNLIIGAKNK